MKHLICLILITHCFTTTNAQKYYEKFSDLGFIIQQGDKIVTATDGNYVLAGSSVADSQVIWHLFVTKLTPQGDTLWLTQIPCTEGYLYSGDMLATEYGYAMAASRIETDGETYYYATIVFIQIDHDGNILNQQDVGTTSNYLTPPHKIAQTIIRTEDNGYLITGYGGPVPGSYSRPYSLKLNADLTVVWENYYEGFNTFPTVYTDNYESLYAFIGDAIINDDGTYYLWGINIGTIAGAILLIQIDAAGNHIWDTLYRPSGWIGTVADQVLRVKRTKDHGFIATGNYGGYRAAPKEAGVFMKFDSSLNYVWKSENLFNTTAASAVFELADGSFVAGGCHETDPITEDWQVRIAKVDSSGGTLWKRTYGTPSHDYCYDMIQTTDGGYLLCGRSYIPSQNKVPLYLIKTNCMGLLTEPQANFTYTPTSTTTMFQNLSQYTYPDSIDGGHYIWDFGDGTTSTEVNPSHVYPQADIYAVTLTAIVCNDTSVFTLTVNTWATGIASPLPPPKEGEMQVGMGVCTVLPNPATNQAQLYHQLPENETTTFNLYNTMGTLVNTTTLNGNGVYKLNTANYQPGLYYYTLSSHDNLLQRGTLVITR